ncbi:protein-disulfide reductase DsbD N-terminal domain-containing protein [Myxococcota bacterium]|nr:protein-disulfide reductase DsbD N-terminal domain-containing protein [Myxococcota bacterium]
MLGTLCALTLSVLWGPALAGGGLPGLPVPASPAVSQATVAIVGGTTTVAPGSSAALELTVVVPPGFHVYQDMLHVQVTDPGGLSLGPPSLPPGLSAPDPAAPGRLREQYDFDAVVLVPVLKAPPAGEHVATFDVRWQACSGGVCLMPRTEQVTARLVVRAP